MTRSISRGSQGSKRSGNGELATGMRQMGPCLIGRMKSGYVQYWKLGRVASSQTIVGDLFKASIIAHSGFALRIQGSCLIYAFIKEPVSAR